MSRSAIGKIISHTTFIVLIFIMAVYVVFPELDAKAGKLPVFLTAFALYALLCWLLAPHGYFRWYTDPDPASVRGTLLKSFVYGVLGLIAGAAIMALIGIALQTLQPNLLKSPLGRWIGLPLNMLPLASAYAGLVFSGATGIYNRERDSAPSA